MFLPGCVSVLVSLCAAWDPLLLRPAGSGQRPAAGEQRPASSLGRGHVWCGSCGRACACAASAHAHQGRGSRISNRERRAARRGVAHCERASAIDCGPDTQSHSWSCDLFTRPFTLRAPAGRGVGHRALQWCCAGLPTFEIAGAHGAGAPAVLEL